MNLLWPGFLFLLLLIPLMIAVYVWILRRRRKFTVRYSSLSLIRAAMPRYSRLRRHLPFALFLAALGSLILALARPISIIAVPTDQTTIMLVMDVSRSMCSTDIKPNRLQAAEAAAISFIEAQKSNTQIGIVAFAGFAEVIQPPTRDTELLKAAVRSLTTGRRTAIGSGLLEGIDAIAELDRSIPPSNLDPASEAQVVPVPKGAYVPNIIVLLTDGASNAGMLPIEAAQQAATRGIRVYTIGFGTANGGEFPNCDPGFVGREGYGGGGYGGYGGQGGGFGGGGGQGGFRRGIDEETLKKVAALTDGEYYSAESTNELHTVFQNLPTYLIVKHEITEVSVAFTAIGTCLVMIAIMLSLRWHPLP
jgi:Ca-activated chloride channel homolog